ncbi:MAG TPA: hypothetical protein VE646_06570 [Actinomycetota bacterium]|nr:hypothetical protein [Actinomycetota bacterium]
MLLALVGILLVGVAGGAQRVRAGAFVALAVDARALAPGSTPRGDTVVALSDRITDVDRGPGPSVWMGTDGAIYRSDPGFSPTSATPTPSPGAGTGPGLPGGVAGLVTLAVLIGLLLYFRSRLNRRSGGS